MLHLDKQIEKWLKVQVDKIKGKIDGLLRTQVEFIIIYKKILKKCIGLKTLDWRYQGLLVWYSKKRKNAYNKYQKNSIKTSSKDLSEYFQNQIDPLKVID